MGGRPPKLLTFSERKVPSSPDQRRIYPMVGEKVRENDKGLCSLRHYLKVIQAQPLRVVHP